MIRLSILPTVCLRKTKASLQRAIEIKVKNSGAACTLAAEAILERASHPLRLQVPQGESRHQFQINEPTRPTELLVRPTGHPRFPEARAPIAPQRPWEIYLLQHSHNDLGYTELPTMVYAAHAEYVDQAIQFCKETARYPKDARFRWNLECSWQLRNYVQRRPPEAVKKLIQQLKEGRIEVSAWYLNMTDVGNLEQTLRAHYFVHDFCRAHQVPLRSSMSCDVNGYPWCLPTVLQSIKVNYHLSALNTTRSISPLDRPCGFWWESPDGGKVLVWHGDHYHMGNYVGLADEPDFLFERLTEYLRKLEHKGYPYPMALLQVSGTYSDNAPPNRSRSDFVRSWNRRWQSPRLRLCTLTEWFNRLRKEIRHQLPVYRQAWPDYWADGLASAPYETALARRARRDIADAEAAHSAVHILRKDHQPLPLDSVYEETTFVNEHTWGYHASASDPFHPQSLAHWNHKAGFFYRSSIGADCILRESRQGIARLVKNDQGKRIAIHNWLSWPRGGLTELSIPTEWLPESRRFRITDVKSSEEVTYQILGETRHAVRIALSAPSVPAFGYRVLSLHPGEAPSSSPETRRDKNELLENEFYRLQVGRSGGIQNLRDKASGRELVNQKHPHRMGELISEEIIHEEGREALNGWWFHTHRNKSPEQEIFRRKESMHGRVIRRDVGPVLSELEVESKSPVLDWLRTTIRLAHHAPLMTLNIRMRKPLHPNPEAFYVAFPFNIPQPTIWFDAAGGPYRPGDEQIEGSCMDFYTLQDFAQICNDQVSVLWIPLDAPLVQLNRISTAQWIRKPPSPTATLYSWAYNNYWTTNFPVTACGDLSLGYVIRAGEPGSGFSEACRASAEAFSPLQTELLGEPQEGPLSEATGSLFRIEPENVHAIGFKPHKQGEGFVLRLQEKAGEKTEACIRFGILQPSTVEPVSLFEEPQKGTVRKRAGEYRIQLPPFGIRALHVRVAGMA
jgi:alpha-mannosidase